MGKVGGRKKLIKPSKFRSNYFWNLMRKRQTNFLQKQSVNEIELDTIGAQQDLKMLMGAGSQLCRNSPPSSSSMGVTAIGQDDADHLLLVSNGSIHNKITDPNDININIVPCYLVECREWSIVVVEMIFIVDIRYNIKSQ